MIKGMIGWAKEKKRKEKKERKGERIQKRTSIWEWIFNKSAEVFSSGPG